MASTSFEGEEREYGNRVGGEYGNRIRGEGEKGNEKEARWKGAALLIGVIAAGIFVVYAIIVRAMTRPAQQSAVEAPTSLSCQPAKRQAAVPLSAYMLQGQYYSLSSSFPSSFSPPAKIWLFVSSSPSPLQLLNQANLLSHCLRTNHSLNIITRSNYSSYFLKEETDQIETYIERALARKEAFYFPGQNQQYSKMVIILYLLEHYGGIYIDDDLTLTEDLSWLGNVQKEVYVNQVDENMPVQFIAFHDPRTSSKLEKPTLRGVESEHYRRVLPTLSPHFLATYPRSTFISALNKKYKQMLLFEGKELLNKLANIKGPNSESVYFLDSYTRGKLFQISSSLVLLQKQQEYEGMGAQNRLFAIDYYGVRSINQLYFSHKILQMMDFRTPENTYYHLARVSLEELEIVTGKLRFMVKLGPEDKIAGFIEEGRNGQQKGAVYKGSFMDKYLLGGETWVQEGLVAAKAEEGVVWEQLPRRVWVFWGDGINQSSVTHQLCTRRMRALCLASNFTYEQVSKSTLPSFLDNQTITLIETTLAASPHKKYQQTYSDFVRLALLYRYGGIYLDTSYVLLQSFSWLVNIPSYSPSLIYNRFGRHPKVFMFFNPQYASDIYRTKQDPRTRTRTYHDLAYENNFIAAEPQNELIKDWFEQFLLYHRTEHSQLKVHFQGCGLDKQAWSTEKWSYLYEMDAVKCVVGRKHRELASMPGEVGAAEYYGVWSMNGYNGVQKLRGFTNFENPDSENNIFSTLFSERYMRDVVGSPQHLVKFFGGGGHQLARFIFSKIDKIQPESMVGSKLLQYREPDQYIAVLTMDPVFVKYQSK